MTLKRGMKESDGHLEELSKLASREPVDMLQKIEETMITILAQVPIT